MPRKVKDLVKRAPSWLAEMSLPSWVQPNGATEEHSTAEQTEKMSKRLLYLEEALKIQKRISGEYFALIESMEGQRNEWKEMFFEQAAEHVQGQSRLEEALARVRQALGSVVTQLNFLRELGGLKKLNAAHEMEEGAPPIGQAEEFRRKVQELTDRAPEETDGMTAREDIRDRAGQ